MSHYRFYKELLSYFFIFSYFQSLNAAADSLSSDLVLRTKVGDDDFENQDRAPTEYLKPSAGERTTDESAGAQNVSRKLRTTFSLDNLEGE